MDASLNFSSITSQKINLYSTDFAIGVQDYRLYFRTGPPGWGNGFEWFSGGSHSSSAGDPGPGGTNLMRLQAEGLTVHTVIKSVGGLIIENRTSDPINPAPGQIWLRTDL